MMYIGDISVMPQLSHNHIWIYVCVFVISVLDKIEKYECSSHLKLPTASDE